MQAILGKLEETERILASTEVIRRHEFQGETFLSLTSLIYMCEVSRDRYHIEGKIEAADALERMALVLETVAIVA